jgi:TFIIF-interacting CTD phosphatase-like protein
MLLSSSHHQSCLHQLTYNDLCVQCGFNTFSLNKNDLRVPLDWLTPGHSGFVATDLNTIKDIYHKDFANMLKNRKLRLVLDLDETLIHTVKLEQQQHIDKFNQYRQLINNGTRPTSIYSYRLSLNQNSPIINFEHSKYQKWMQTVHVEQLNPDCFTFSLNTKVFVVFLRPHLQQFLNQMANIFDIYMYTNGTERYANVIHQHLTTLFQNRNYIQAMFSRKSKHIREKKNLFRMLCKRSVSIIVDDRSDVWDDKDRDNIINVTPYKYEGFLGEIPSVEDEAMIDPEEDNDDDQELLYLADHLKVIHSEYFLLYKSKKNQTDVRTILQVISSKCNEL